MLPYTNRARSADAKEQYELARSCTYDLMSVVVHVGEIDTGHYISYCRVGDQVSKLVTLMGKAHEIGDARSQNLTRSSGSLSTTIALNWRPSLMYSEQRPTFCFTSCGT